MKKDWRDIFGGYEDPVRGRLHEYETAECEFGTLADTSAAIKEEFSRLTSARDTSEIQGKTADQLVTLVNEIDNALGSVAPVMKQIENLFSTHAAGLEDLHSEVSRALDVANSRWNDHSDKSSTEDADRATVSWIETQLKALDWSPEPEEALESRRVDLDRDRRDRGRRLAASTTAREASFQTLELSRSAHAGLVEKEAALIDATVEGFRNLDMYDLKDGSRWGEIFGAVFGYLTNPFVDLWDGIAAFAEALAGGDWMELVWELQTCWGVRWRYSRSSH